MFHRAAPVHLYLCLYFNLQDGSDDGQEVADDDQHVPAVQKLFLVVLTHFAIMILQQELGEPLKIHQSQRIILQTRTTSNGLKIHVRIKELVQGDVVRRNQLTWSSLMASIMERVHSVADVRQTRMTKQSNTRNKCMFFSAGTQITLVPLCRACSRV